MTGGRASGGTSTAAVGGNAAATGGTPSSGSGGQPAATGGMPADFCTGGAKVDYHGQVAAIPVTTYQPLDMRSCCTSDGIRLHTRESIGADLLVIVSRVAGMLDPGTYEVAVGTFSMSAGLRTTDESNYTVHPAAGQVYVTGETPEVTPWQMGVCLTVSDPSSDLDGTRVYVPGVPMDYYGATDRFAIWLLGDPSLNAVEAAQVALGSLTLAAVPLMTLGDIEYVEQTSGWIAFNKTRNSAAGDALHSELGQVELYGLPFVVVADGVPIYLGGFFPGISSVAIPNPMVTVDFITNDGFTIDDAEPGPRNDPRILKVLAETGRLSP
jgi:hypothetical protein